MSLENLGFGLGVLGRYAGSNENFVLVRTGITAVLSFEFPVMSEDGNRFYSKLMSQNSKRQVCLYP
jgi:hypothetical protein